MKKITLKFCIIAASLLGGNAIAQTSYLVDFNQNATATYVTPGNWNNFQDSAAGTLNAIISDAGVASTINMAVTDAFVAANGTGTTAPTGTHGFPATATSDSFYIQDGANATAEITISGLNPANTYSFMIFASRAGVADNRVAKYTLTGTNVGTGTLNASNNTANTSDINNISPTAGGTIVLKLEKDASSTGTFAYLGCFKMTEVGAVPIVNQVLLDCEDGTTNQLAVMNVFANGATGSNADMVVVDNPNPSGVNTSSKCIQFTRRTTGADPWAGFYAVVTDPDPDMTTAKYVHVKILKPTTSAQKFKIEGGPDGTFEIASSNSYETANVWQDIVFDYSLMTPTGGTYPIVAFLPDFEDPLVAGADRMIYFDDIIVNNDPTGVVIVPPPPPTELVLLDCEDGTTNKLATMNVFANGPGQSNADMVVVDNPNPTGLNTSTKCIQFTRRTSGADAMPWAGFWCPVTDPDPDFTTDKYVHVKVMKANTSIVKFKIEGGPAGTSEIASVNAYTTPGQWQDMVFDYTSRTGVYPIVALLPDFDDPLTAGADRIIYFDDIKVNNNPNPATLGIKGNDLAQNIAVYPNPTSRILNIETSEEIQSATIFTYDGRVISTINKFEIGVNTINTSDLSNGLYLIKFEAKNGATSTKKFIKN